MKRKKEKNIKTENGDVKKSSGSPKKRLERFAEKWEEKWEENRLRAYFVRLFEKYDIRKEEQFIRFGKWLIFIVLVWLEILIMMQYVGNIGDGKLNGGWVGFLLLLGTEILLAVAEALTLFVKKDGGGKLALYVIDALTACALMFFTEGTYPIVIYMLVLTEFYIDAVRAKTSMALFCICLPVYVTSRGIKFFLLAHGKVALWQILTQSLGGVLALCVHFLIVNVALAFYRQFLKLDKTLKELDESNQKLEKAYARAAEVSALEERQRIAKEIHDTAGHSITTVIMQTEAAKLIIDNDTEAAKSKIIAANLQAKHALEELRDSVHLLSGMKGNVTLKMALEHIIHESMDGTGVKIRSQIEDVTVGDAKYRFLCNSLKEGISNGLRHGKATAFWFELKEEGGELRFLLSDNGVGMSGSAVKEGFGLTTMQERARAFGGKVAFESEMEEGFEICITLPMDNVDILDKA